MSPSSYSITRRIVLLVLTIEFAAALCVTAVAVLYERQTHFRAFDVLLRGRADSLLGAVQDAEDSGDNIMLDSADVRAPHDDIYEVTDVSGRLLGRSSNWNGPSPDDFSSKPEKNPRLTGDAEFYTIREHHQSYRLIRIQGTRIVDPGDKGGIPRHAIIYYGASTRRVWGAVWQAAGFYAASSVAVLMVTGIVLLWLLDRSLAPLRQLASAAGKVSASSWDFAPPENARSIRELSPLVEALESLLAGLQRSFTQQRRFVGDAAHELKTGVALVKSSLQLLILRERNVEEYKTGIVRSITHSERMETLVARMLTLARIEEHHDTASDIGESVTADRAQRSALVYVLREAAADLASVAQERNINISFRDEKEVVAVIGAEPLRLLATNLLHNAIQHSPGGAEVVISVTQSNQMAVFQIEDHGEGIAPEDLPHVFNRFYRSDSSRSRKTGGTGLGLAIAKAIVEQYHGTIALGSQLGQGTTAIVALPIFEQPTGSWGS
jgi:signal transduction histidine kinase